MKPPGSARTVIEGTARSCARWTAAAWAASHHRERDKQLCARVRYTSKE
jgi:hypothetical protein